LSVADWRSLLDGDPAAAEAFPLYASVLGPPARSDGCTLIGRAAQSLDGYIATRTGASRWIGGAEDILHTHRLRALCDAVMVGAGTVRADDPLLTTRACDGPSPVRVVLDPDRRLDAGHRLFAGGAPTVLLAAADGDRTHGAAEVEVLARDADGLISPGAIRAALARRGLRRVLLEGGGRTVSRFLLAGALDRLHVTIAPLLLGDGIPAFVLPPASDPSAGLRFAWTAYRLGADLLLDIPLRQSDPARPA
jgi:riboflavin-specific deaminase-like protein